jgi:hypothetical protein
MQGRRRRWQRARATSRSRPRRKHLRDCTHDHVRDAGDDPRSQHDARAGRLRRGTDLLVRGPAPEFHEVRRDVRIPQPSLDRGVQRAALRLIDTAHDGADTLKCRSDRCIHSHVKLSAASPMTDRGCRGFRFLETTSGHDHLVVGRQVRRDAPRDDAVAAGDENVLLAHGISPSD